MLTQDDVLQNRYRIVGLLGRGGMGAVYRAWDTRLSIPVAIKEMEAQPGLDAATLDDLRRQFQQEATVLARLTHPNLVGVTDYFQEGRNVYLVMRFVDGESLAERIRRQGPIPEAQALAWARELLDAIAYCHSQGVIHRDIKPQNIIIDATGSAILVDFGLVKLWDADDPGTRTAMRGLGTPEYAPPEQYELAQGHTESSSDLYSLGATLYHALLGKAPPTATMRVAEPGSLVPIRSLRPEISDRTTSAIERAMALARAKRWSSAGEMARALGLGIRQWDDPGSPEGRTEVLSGAGLTIPIPEAAVPAKPVRRFPLWILATLAALFFTGTFAVAALEFVGVLNLGLAARLRPGSMAETTPSVTPSPEQGLPPKSPVALVSNVATATWTPTPTPRPSETPSPTATARPSPTPRPSSTPRPSPTATSEPEVTPTQTATVGATDTPKPTATPSATPEPSSGPTGAVVDFESFGTWRRGDEPNGELTQTAAQVKGGSYAAQLDYSFPATGIDYVVFNQSHPIGGTPNNFSVWVYGDGSGHFLNLWVTDAQGEIWSIAMGTVGGAGWRQLTGQLAPGLAWPSGRISGPDNGKVDYPVTFTALVLDRPEAGPQQGRIYLDEITAWSGTVTAPTVAPTTDVAGVTAPPPETAEPPTGLGQILLTAQTSTGSYLYTTDPAWNQMSEVGSIDPNSATCNAGLSAVATLSGQSYNVTRYSRCEVTERTDACTSPDGNYKLITNFLPGWEYAVLLKNVSDGTETFIYQGKLATAAGVMWDSTSRYVYLGIGGAIQVVPVATQQLQQVISAYDDSWPPQFSPDGSKLLYLKPAGGLGNADVFVVDVTGANERNLTNAPGTTKRCPVWRR